MFTEALEMTWTIVLAALATGLFLLRCVALAEEEAAEQSVSEWVTPESLRRQRQDGSTSRSTRTQGFPR